MTGDVPRSTDPLAPIEFVVTCVSALIALLFAATLAFTAFGSGSLLGLGEPDACVQVDADSVPFGEGDGPGGFQVVGLRPEATSLPADLRICRENPGVGLEVAAAADDGAATFALLVGCLVVLRLLIRSARRHGLFAREVAARTQLLGWFLLLGALGKAAIEAVGRGIVTASAVDHTSWTDGLSRIEMPWTLLIVGTGVLTFGRVLRQAVELQDEVDATI